MRIEQPLVTRDSVRDNAVPPMREANLGSIFVLKGSRDREYIYIYISTYLISTLADGSRYVTRFMFDFVN